MTVTIRIPRPLFSSSPQRNTLAAQKLPAQRSFHATLSDCADDWVVQGSPRTLVPATRPKQRNPRGPEPRTLAPSTVARAWSWLNSKYKLTAAKRLRVAETVSLGEKRFVALICVEGREFLIGGGTAGVSLLAQLGTARETAEDSQ